MSTAFRAVLEGNQEVPPNNSTASGRGTVIFDSEAVAASYSFRVDGVDYGPVTGGQAQTPTTRDDVISTHFHNAERGENGPVVFGQINPAQDEDDLSIVLNKNDTWTVSGTWETTDPANDSLTNFSTTLDSAEVGSDVPLYYNVHTTRVPAGENRGQRVAIADDDDNIVNGTKGRDFLPGLGGNDIVLGFAGNDTLDGGEGEDILAGFGGADQFVFRAASDNAAASGDDLIVDFNTSRDTVLLEGFEADFDPLANLSEGLFGATLDLGDAGQVVFLGASVDEFTQGDFDLIA